jgi:hypothetical protein
MSVAKLVNALSLMNWIGSHTITIVKYSALELPLTKDAK